MPRRAAPQGNYTLSGLVGFEMKNKAVGVVGTGAIGVEACRILKVRRAPWGAAGTGVRASCMRPHACACAHARGVALRATGPVGA
jgi:hypothetical protein